MACKFPLAASAACFLRATQGSLHDRIGIDSEGRGRCEKFPSSGIVERRDGRRGDGVNRNSDMLWPCTFPWHDGDLSIRRGHGQKPFGSRLGELLGAGWDGREDAFFGKKQFFVERAFWPGGS